MHAAGRSGAPGLRLPRPLPAPHRAPRSRPLPLPFPRAALRTFPRPQPVAGWGGLRLPSQLRELPRDPGVHSGLAGEGIGAHAAALARRPRHREEQLRWSALCFLKIRPQPAQVV
jgi:hypothetical protein